ncbi:MAG: ABC transporter substrate-binding protein [Oscillospiraceae bacterium]|nr:ABC transporter substrate-binding protein [Oscillospiraceae bacterium]
MRKTKSLLCVLVFLLFLSSAVSCKKTDSGGSSSESPESVTIKWWSMKIFASDGDAGSEKDSFVKELAEAYTASHSNVIIDISYLPYTYEDELAAAISSGEVPDVVFARPGLDKVLEGQKLADLSGIISPEIPAEASAADSSGEKTKAALPIDIPEPILKAASADGGKTYNFYPVAVSPYLMAFNKNILEVAGALSLLPKLDGNRSWTMEEYKALLKELAEKLPDSTDTGIFFYGSTAGSVATQSLAENAFGSQLASINDANGVKALGELKALVDDGLLLNGYSAQAEDSVSAFIEGSLAHSLIYTLGYDLNYKEAKKDNFNAIFMPYPSSGDPKLYYTLLGASVIDSGDAARTSAAIDFVNFIANDPIYSPEVAGRSGSLSANKNNNAFIQSGDYQYLIKTLDMLGDYKNGAQSEEVKTAWVNTLRDVFTPDLVEKSSGREIDISSSLDQFVKTVAEK